MLEFIKEEKRLVLSYSGELRPSGWIYSELEKGHDVTLRRTFTVSKNELWSEEDPIDEEAPVLFVIGSKNGQYYSLSRTVMGIEHDLFIHEDIELTTKIFIAERNISIFSRLDQLIKGDVRIGGQDDSSIPEEAFTKLLRNFPNSYELTRYAFARVGAVISSYLKTKEDYEEKYQNYMDRRASIEGSNAYQLVANAEIEKYKLLLSKLKGMLEKEESYSETQWQEEILQIILLLYPKYILAFKEAPVRDTYNKKDRKIDILLVDSTGNADIIEIKKPFDKCIVTDRTYRDNYIPLRELSGTVMQIEKYIFYLNKWGRNGEEKLTSHYQDKLEPGFSIRITSPGGIIIMGRETGLSAEQRQDFEVIKRKYKSLIDIITYDDLLARLESTLKHWTKHT
ncbi:Shedu immune nuclease family protein [Pseudohongiella sp. O18]|uniref:Shedu immune nuclease family protein n=1 Tax=Pseudohongiella sp. O18 TaxID=2904248 RepID=UPI001F491940|nr:Shedu immune nuclease family protein [Pseudohongiella sp. O18]